MLIRNQNQLEQLKTRLSTERVVCIDFETNITDSWNDRFAVGVAIATAEGADYIPIDHRCEIASLGPNFDGALPSGLLQGIPVITAHNAKFDIQMAEKIGLTVSEDQVACTLMMSHFIDENPPHGLDDLGQLYFQVGKTGAQHIKEMAKVAGGNERVPSMAMGMYAEQDAVLGRSLFLRLESEFKPYENLWTEVDRPFLLLLSKMEKKGIVVDSITAKEKAAATYRRMEEIKRLVGFNPASKNELEKKLLSDPPVGIGLVPKFFSAKTGKPSLTGEWLESVGHPITALVLEFRSCQKVLSSYYEPYQRHGGEDFRIHPTYKPWGTVTGRLSCENPNLQQIPREQTNDVVKKLFKAEDGCELWEFDYRTIELRVMALYSEMPELIQIFKDERDYHQEIADALKISRHQAKTVNYLIGYGGGEMKLAAQLGVKKQQATTILDTYRTRFPALFEKMYEAEQLADLNGYVSMWTGRNRHFKYSSEHRKAFNSLCQGGAFEIVKRSMLSLDRAGYDIRNQVHDSVWINIPRENVAEAIVDIPSLMSDWTEKEFGLRFSIDAKRLA